MARMVSLQALDAEIKEFEGLQKRKRCIYECAEDAEVRLPSFHLSPPALSVRARLPITPIPPERFYGLDIKSEKSTGDDSCTAGVPTADDAWQKKLESLRKPVGDTYAEFSRQELAFRFVDERPGEGLHVFAKERKQEGESGLRTYIATTYKEFWNRYIAMAAAVRNYYEVIREGMCCNLYFDIEFLKAENPHIVVGHHEEELMKAFMKLIGREVQLFFSLPFRVRRRHFIDLDSSDDRKFSRHLILRLPDNYAFINNVHCGHFVKMVHHKLSLLRQLRRQEAERKAQIDQSAEEDIDDAKGLIRDKNDISDEMLERLFVKTDKGKEAFIVDMGVYTRNRNFRLIYSTKVGKCLFLRPSSINRYAPPEHIHTAGPAEPNSTTNQEPMVRIKVEKTEEVDEESNTLYDEVDVPPLSYSWFLSSLVARVGEGKETDAIKAYLLSCEPVPSEDGRSVLFYAHYLTPATLPPNLVLGIPNLPRFTFSPPAPSSMPIRPPPLPRVTPECSPNPTSPSASSALYSPPLFLSPYQPALPFYALPSMTSSYSSGSSSSSSIGSGFPAIDDCIAAHVGGERPGRRGGIRSVRKWGDLIVYNISGNRYCENIGREHKSNHIMIVVDLRSGTFYQKCYDPDCQSMDYRSPEHALPPDICPVITSVQPTGNITAVRPRESSNWKVAANCRMPPNNCDDQFLSDEVLFQSILQDPSLWP